MGMSGRSIRRVQYLLALAAHPTCVGWTHEGETHEVSP